MLEIPVYVRHQQYFLVRGVCSQRRAWVARHAQIKACAEIRIQLRKLPWPTERSDSKLGFPKQRSCGGESEKVKNSRFSEEQIIGYRNRVKRSQDQRAMPAAWDQRGDVQGSRLGNAFIFHSSQTELDEPPTGDILPHSSSAICGRETRLILRPARNEINHPDHRRASVKRRGVALDDFDLG
jgi:hypothetical protein